MKQETKELVEWLKDHLSHYRNQLTAGQIKVGLATGEKEEKNAYEAINFLDSLPEIESHLCNGGYIQDKNGTPCCHGDKVKFKFSKKDFDEYWKDKYAPIENGELKYCVEDKKFVILFGEGVNGFDWIDWNGVYEGCEWFEKEVK